MREISDSMVEEQIAPFDRAFFDSGQRFKSIGRGSLGGKAKGLAFAQTILTTVFDPAAFPSIEVSIPSLVVLRTGVFDTFMERNGLWDVALKAESDDAIARAFQRAELPAEVVGDLRAVIEHYRGPLAIRSSSLLEDALHEPFAGVYATKMIPNNQSSPDGRFRRLAEAIRFVYASTFFSGARQYLEATRHHPGDERMAVIIQEVVGHAFGDRYYPHLSGVARSYNFYAMGRSKPEDGVASLALGLGKTIVDGGRCWTYVPAHPRIAPPYGSPAEEMKQTQSEFFAVNLGKPPAYDPIRETEYLVTGTLTDAESDGSISLLASTFDAGAGKITMGTGTKGMRVLDFAMLLVLREVAVNDVVRRLLAACAETLDAPVEIEFAMSLHPHRFGFLQVRPMAISSEAVSVDARDLERPDALVASARCLGNGESSVIRDVVYVKPDVFEARHTREIAGELEAINRDMLSGDRPYLLIGFGRWGSSDPWLGIPVGWGQISGARAIVEATLPSMDVEISQGAHFFHNITNLGVGYFSVPWSGSARIDWGFLAAQPTAGETTWVRHVRLDRPLTTRLDGRTGRGVVLR